MELILTAVPRILVSVFLLAGAWLSWNYAKRAKASGSQSKLERLAWLLALVLLVLGVYQLGGYLFVIASNLIGGTSDSVSFADPFQLLLLPVVLLGGAVWAWRYEKRANSAGKTAARYFAIVAFALLGVGGLAVAAFFAFILIAFNGYSGK